MEDAGYTFECLAPLCDERTIADLNPKKQAQLRAAAKAEDVASQLQKTGQATSFTSWIIGCDQVLEFEGRSYDKASSRQEAEARLREFSARKHYLHSAVSIWTIEATQNPKEHCEFVESATMQMRCLDDSLLTSYLDTNEWMGCVGCYRIEARGIHLFEAIEGDSSTIIGLPLIRLSSELRKIGISFS
jgi:septum formation protein